MEFKCQYIQANISLLEFVFIHLPCQSVPLCLLVLLFVKTMIYEYVV